MDKKLIAAGRGLLPAVGLSGLSIREVARKAGVNIGMFHYHFKTMRAFQARILQESYEEFFGTLHAAAEGPGDSLGRLRALLLAAARFARGNRVFPYMMIRELLNAHPEARAFAKANFPRHVGLVAGILEQCRREGKVRDLPVPVLATFAMSAMAIPVVFMTALERNGIKRLAGHSWEALDGMMLSDDTIEARVEMVLAALKAPGAR